MELPSLVNSLLLTWRCTTPTGHPCASLGMNHVLFSAQLIPDASMASKLTLIYFGCRSVMAMYRLSLPILAYPRDRHMSDLSQLF